MFLMKGVITNSKVYGEILWIQYIVINRSIYVSVPIACEMTTLTDKRRCHQLYFCHNLLMIVMRYCLLPLMQKKKKKNTSSFDII